MINKNSFLAKIPSGSLICPLLANCAVLDSIITTVVTAIRLNKTRLMMPAESGVKVTRRCDAECIIIAVCIDFSEGRNENGVSS